MNRNIALIVGAVLIVLIGGFWFIRSQSKTETTPSDYNQTVSPVGSTSVASEKPATDGAAIAEGAQQFVVTGSNFKFDPTEIKVKKGSKVSIVFKNLSGLHDLIVDDYNVATKRLQSGESETITFTADKAGTFEYYCSVGNHRQVGMKGNLVVE